MASIKTYNQVNREHPSRSFGISRMENVYRKRGGVADTPHRHDFYTILLVRSGKGQHWIDFVQYELAHHQVFFISPGQVHQLIEEKETLGYSMVFSVPFLIENNIPQRFIEDLNLFRDYGEGPPLLIEETQLQQLSSYCEEMFHYSQSGIKFKERAIAALLELFLINCNNICSLPFDDTQKLEAGNTILKGFKDLVEQNYATWHSTSSYAKALHITPDHLNRTIKSLIGKTAKEYIQSRITTEAKRLLFFADLTNKEIAYQLGFSEPANFSAFFKKCTGMSPTAFKKRF